VAKRNGIRCPELRTEKENVRRSVARILELSASKWLRRLAMGLEYRITRDRDTFIAYDSDQQLVGVFDTEEAARSEIAR
jgi:hypothetical protein